LHPWSSQFTPHAKSLKDIGGSWIFCLSMMFNYFFTNCNWIFENVFLRPFVHLRFWNFCSQSGLQIIFLDELLNFLLIKCCWNFWLWSALDFFSHDMLFKFFSCLLGEDWFLKFLSSKFGLCLLLFWGCLCALSNCKRSTITSLAGHSKGCNTSQWWWFWSTQKLSIAIVIVKMIMFVVTQLSMNVFVKWHFSWGCCQKGLDISGTKCMCKVSYGDFLHCTMIRTSVEWIYWQDPSIYTNTILNIKWTKQVNMPFLWYS
jgi:hypothetical protein